MPRAVRLRRLVQFNRCPTPGALRSVFVLPAGFEGEPSSFVPPEKFHGRNREGCPQGGSVHPLYRRAITTYPTYSVREYTVYTRTYPPSPPPPSSPFPLSWPPLGEPLAEPGRIGANWGRQRATLPPILPPTSFRALWGCKCIRDDCRILPE